jgi:ParB family protein of integrating conjugative element (PFGI_1 class)
VSGEQNERGDMTVMATVPAASTRARPTSIEERRRLVAESLQVGNPLNRSKDLPEQADPRHDCQIELKVDEIRPYEHNPRRANNAKFAEIKESIRSTGIRNPLTVTRRPGNQHFIVEAGGNTRLLAVQQLWAETRDPRFEKLTVLFRPWQSEGHVLVAHLIENEQRGEMTFWDKANGVVALKARFEEEKGRTLSLRQLEDELKAAGFPVNTATLAHYLYATARLRILGDAIPALSGLDVKTLQPRLNLLKRYAQLRDALDEATLYALVFEPVFRRHADAYLECGKFNAPNLCEACEEALARHLGEDLARFRMVLDALAQSPQAASLETLGEPSLTVSSANSTAATAEREPGAAAASSASSPVQRLKASISRFAELAAKHGLEARARSLLGLVCDQLDENVRAELGEALGFTGPHSSPSVLDGHFLNWLLDGRDAASAAFWEVATVVRDLRSGSA